MITTKTEGKSIFKKEHHIDPQYAFLDRYVTLLYKSFWVPSKYEKSIRETDAPHFFNVMGSVDQETISRCILATSIVEDKLKTYWSTLPLDIPQTVVGDVGGVFAQSEVTHRRSYHALLEALKIDPDDIEKYDVLRDRIAYLNKYTEVDPKIIGKKRVLKKLVLFTSLVERCSLFTQFYILMSYEKSMKGLTTISSLQASTACEEELHYRFGIDLINIIKKEHPNMWDEYLTELIEKNLQEAYNAELKLIDWFFEKGTPEHLTKQEVVNFLNSNFNVVCRDLNLELRFDVDDELYVQKNEWFNIKLKSTEPDFFYNHVGGYSSEKEEIDVENFQF